MLDHADVVVYLVNRGLLEVRAVVDGRVRVIDASRRNTNYHVIPDDMPGLDSRGLVVKQCMATEHAPGTVAYEAAVHDVLRAIVSAGLPSARIPMSFGTDADARALVLEFATGDENVREYHYRLGRTPEVVAATMGDTLGALHSAGRRVMRDGGLEGLSTELPETFDLTLPRTAMIHGTSAGMRALISAMQSIDGLVEPLSRLAVDWRRDTLIHGDPRWDNWVVHETGAPEKLVLVDWEFARVGDAAWDVGSLIGDYLGAWVLNMPELPGSPLADASSLTRFPLEDMQPSIRELWNAYLQRRQPNRPEEELGMVARCAAAKLIQLCAEQMYHASKLNAAAGALLQLAANVFANPEQAAYGLLGIDFSAVTRSA